jgi:hypothetical protein
MISAPFIRFVFSPGTSRQLILTQVGKASAAEPVALSQEVLPGQTVEAHDAERHTGAELAALFSFWSTERRTVAMPWEWRGVVVLQ